MKKILPFAISCVATITLLTGCGSRGSSSSESVDSTKTQLHVKYFNGGLRDEWIQKVCDSFESKYASYSFESGKKGVQIVKEFVKYNPNVSSINSSSNEVFWVEDMDYYDAVSKGQLLDVTDVVQSEAVTGPDTKETSTIESKMRDGSKSYYNLGTDSAAKYYAVPAYENSIFMNYNVDLFDDKGLYLAKGKCADDLGSSIDLTVDSDELEGLFVEKSTDEKSTGPDGKAGTLDDGLPATYADLQALITYMKLLNVTPFVWQGVDLGYLTSLGLRSWAASSGADQMNISLTFEGTSKNMISIDDSGKAVKEDDVAITGENAYRVHEQQGLLDALNLAKIIIGNDGKNYYSKSMSSSFSQTTEQDYFMNGFSKHYISSELGIMIEGNWWNSEAYDKYGSTTDYMTRRYGVMPIPHATKAQIGENNVILSDRQSMLFIRKSTSESMLPCAKTFLSFINNDESMNTFTRYTRMMRMMKYSLSQETLDNINYYGKAVYEYTNAETTDHIDWHPASTATKKNISLVSYRTWPFSIDSTNTNPYTYFASHTDVSAEDYFELVNSYYKKNWSSIYSAK